MNINQQTKEAKKLTDQLLKLIVTKCNTTLNKNAQGCYVSKMSIVYFPDHTELEITFNSSDTISAPITNFTCKSSLYDH